MNIEKMWSNNVRSAERASKRVVAESFLNLSMKPVDKLLKIDRSKPLTTYQKLIDTLCRLAFANITNTHQFDNNHISEINEHLLTASYMNLIDNTGIVNITKKVIKNTQTKNILK